MNKRIRDFMEFTQNRKCSWGLLFLYNFSSIICMIIYHKEEATRNGFTVVLSRFMKNRLVEYCVREKEAEKK